MIIEGRTYGQPVIRVIGTRNRLAQMGKSKTLPGRGHNKSSGFYLQDNDVTGFWPLLTLLNRKFHLLTFLQVSEALPLYCGLVDKDIISTIALEIMQELGHKGNFLSHPHTKKWFREELYIPSDVIDRDTLEAWEKKGAKSTWDRAQDRVNSLLTQYQPSPISEEVKKELRDLTTKAANKAGMEKLPDLSFE
jgi:hypothetical protein